MKVLTILKDIWLIVCVIGNVYQVIEISGLYFKYEVVTIVNIDYPQSFKPPAFTVCLYTVDIIKWPEALEKQPQLKEKLQADNVSLDDIETSMKAFGHDQKVKYDAIIVSGKNSVELFELTLDANDLFFNCTFLSNDSYLVESKSNCNDVFNVKPFFKECYKCFTFNSKNETEYLYLPAMKAIGRNGYINSVKIRNEIVQNRCENAPIYFSEAGTLPRSASSIFITPLNQTILLTIDAYQSIMLPAPYVSQCINYGLQGLTGDDHCYECCARNESVKVFNGSLFPGPCITKRCENDMISIAEIMGSGNKSDSKNEKMLGIQRQCQKVCEASDCNKKIVIPSILSTNSAEDNVFTSYVQQTPDIVTTFIPTLDVIEFLTQISSTFGVWAGLSFFSLYDLFFFVKSEVKCGRKKKEDYISSPIRENESGNRGRLPYRRNVVRAPMPINGTRRINASIGNLDWSPAEKIVLDIQGTKVTGGADPCTECTIAELLNLRNNKRTTSTRNGMPITRRDGRAPNLRSNYHRQPD